MLEYNLTLLNKLSKSTIPILELVISADFLLMIRNPFYPKYKRMKYYYSALLVYSILTI